MKKLVVTLLLIFGASAVHAEIYTWKDARGNEHYTNSLHEIPQRYLKKARVVDIATGKKGKLATAPPAPGTAPATPGPTAQSVVPGQQGPTAAPVGGNAASVPNPPAPAVTSPSGNAMIVNPSSPTAASGDLSDQRSVRRRAYLRRSRSAGREE